MKHLAYLLILIFPIIVHGQDKTIKLEDFNKDGFIDSLESYYEGGVSAGGIYVSLISGKTNEKFELDNSGGFESIKQIIIIPPVLRKKDNEGFLIAIKKE